MFSFVSSRGRRWPVVSLLPPVGDNFPLTLPHFLFFFVFIIFFLFFLFFFTPLFHTHTLTCNLTPPSSFSFHPNSSHTVSKQILHPSLNTWSPLNVTINFINLFIITLILIYCFSFFIYFSSLSPIWSLWFLNYHYFTENQLIYFFSLFCHQGIHTHTHRSLAPTFLSLSLTHTHFTPPLFHLWTRPSRLAHTHLMLLTVPFKLSARHLLCWYRTTPWSAQRVDMVRFFRTQQKQNYKLTIFRLQPLTAISLLSQNTVKFNPQ